MSSIAEKYEHEGVPVEIHYDYDNEGANPREMDNVTTFVCWHPDYMLGDYQIHDMDGRGAIGQLFETERGRSDFKSMEHLRRYLSFTGAKCISPLYLYDHSGISISVGSPNVFDSGGWDTTMVGFAFCTEDGIEKCCGDDPQYRTDEWMQKAIQEDVKWYDTYLTGQVYGYIVAPDTEDEQACWGYLGDESAKEEANMIAADVAVDVAERERVRRIAMFHPDTLVAS